MTCPRAKRDVYRRFDEGEEDDHVASCAECQAALEVARWLRDLFPGVGASDRPPVGWQERVLARIDEREQTRTTRSPRPRWWWAAAATTVAASAVLLLLVWPRGPTQPNDRDGPVQGSVIEVEVVPGGAPTRGAMISVADVVRIRAPSSGVHTALWVYRGGQELVLRCPDDERCREQRGVIAVDLKVDRPGVYQILFLTSSHPLPPPGETLDGSISAAAIGGVRYNMRDFDVQ